MKTKFKEQDNIVAERKRIINFILLFYIILQLYIINVIICTSKEE